MKLFTALFEQLDRTTSTSEKQRLLTDYFKQANPEDVLWTIALFAGKKPPRSITSTQLKAWGAREAGLPDWLFELTYHTIGDLAECISLVLPEKPSTNPLGLQAWMLALTRLKSASAEEKEAFVLEAWSTLNREEVFIFNKLITGGFRIGLSQGSLVKALAAHTGLAEASIKYCLAGNWSPLDTTLEHLLNPEKLKEDPSKPYPLCLAYAVESTFQESYPASDFAAELKWDGIRAQVIHRNNEAFNWSRGEELITHHFPEIITAIKQLPNGLVLDGELLVWQAEKPGTFLELQKRINTQKPSKKLLQTHPVVLMAYDLLEYEGEDWRSKPWKERREKLEAIAVHFPENFLLSEIKTSDDWETLTAWRAEARQVGAEGLMLKNIHSIYGSGRTKGLWWKWKLDPYTADMVLLYAMAGHGRRANLYTDFTLAVKDGAQLVPVAKAYSGLTDAEIKSIDAWIKANTLERFGPVRSVKAELVFEVAFEGINLSNRHKAGVALRFPRILRWRTDKTAQEIDTLDHLKSLTTVS